MSSAWSGSLFIIDRTIHHEFVADNGKAAVEIVEQGVGESLTGVVVDGG